MTPSPAPRIDATGCIAALLGSMLAVLLAALLGVAGRAAARRGLVWETPCDGTYDDLLTGVLRAEAEADFSYEPWVEWEAVPAPWRNGRLLPRRHEARRLRRDGIRPSARMRGPPERTLTPRSDHPGIA